MPWWDFASSSGQCRLEVLQYVQLVHKYGETSSLTQMLKHYRTLPSGCVLCGCPRVSGGAAAQIFPSHNEYHVINIQIVNVGECERHLHRSKKMHLGSEVIDKACHLGIKLTCGGAAAAAAAAAVSCHVQKEALNHCIAVLRYHFLH